jgi:hypothetical protein
MFPQWFFAGLVLGSLLMSLAGVASLLTMFVRDWRKRSLW